MVQQRLDRGRKVISQFNIVGAVHAGSLQASLRQYPTVVACKTASTCSSRFFTSSRAVSCKGMWWVRTNGTPLLCNAKPPRQCCKSKSQQEAKTQIPKPATIPKASLLIGSNGCVGENGVENLALALGARYCDTCSGIRCLASSIPEDWHMGSNRQLPSGMRRERERADGA